MPERRQAQRTITLICAVADRKLRKPVVAPIGGYSTSRPSSRSVMRYQGHGQVRRTFCGLIAVGDRRHDDHHRVVVTLLRWRG
jgi:hypothetical protein